MENDYQLDKQIILLQKSGSPLIRSYEDIVVYSSHMGNDLIDRLADEFVGTINEFEEIYYLIDRFSRQTLQRLCLYHKEKVTANTDLSPLLGRIDDDCLSALIKTEKS